MRHTDFKSHSNSLKDQNYSDSLYLACPVCALSTFGGPAAWKHTAKRWHSTLIRGSHRNYRTVTNCVPRIPILLHNGKAASCPQVSYLCIRVHFSNALLHEHLPDTLSLRNTQTLELLTWVNIQVGTSHLAPLCHAADNLFRVKVKGKDTTGVGWCMSPH